MCIRLCAPRPYHCINFVLVCYMQVAQFKQAVKDGDIVWHAACFNMQAENMNPELMYVNVCVFVYVCVCIYIMYVFVCAHSPSTHSPHIHHTFTILSQYIHNTFTAHSQYIHNTSTIHSPHIHHTFATHSPHIHHTFTTHSPHIHHTSPHQYREACLQQKVDMDQQFYNENRTIVASIRDVIYVTRGLIPLLRRYGIEGLTIGSNDADYPPQVPKLHVSVCVCMC